MSGIRDEAKAIYFARCDEVSRLAPQFEEDEVIDLIARAIRADRERCLSLISDYPGAYNALRYRLEAPKE